jgi:rhodanese-related sulfurtransferase
MSTRCTLGLAVVLAATLSGCALEWEAVQGEIREQFPDVRQLTIEELRALQAEDGREIMLLDVRAIEEYAISHLPGALHTPTEESALCELRKSSSATLAVLYCSVGWRSSQMASSLEASCELANLEGSIFAWANAGYPLVGEDGPARAVHPYNERWGALLKRELRAD